MNIKTATTEYESWAAQQIQCDDTDLKAKHDQMAADAFPFLRATFYRWIQVWAETCRDLTSAPTVLSVGDLHLENFGTWRDSEGRLIWGVNDFDEAFPLPYTNDLVRLAASVQMAISANHLGISFKEACDALLTGYMESLQMGGNPYVLAERHKALREVAFSNLRDPIKFWEKLDALPTLQENISNDALTALQTAMPEPELGFRLVRRYAGLGSRGHLRYVAIATWRGGKIAREVKQLAPSACLWALNISESTHLSYQSILDCAIRTPDPTVHLENHWIVRRLAPDCSKIEVASLARERDEIRLLRAMGWETANIHLGTPKAQTAILQDLSQRSSVWLLEASKTMVKTVIDDWKEWKKHWSTRQP